MEKILLLFLYFSIVSSYDYVMMNQEVVGTICKFHDCKKEDLLNLPPRTLNLHGFWPEFEDSTHKAFSCQPNYYDTKEIYPIILSDLNENWVGVYNNSDVFRSHEWGKHGTCWNDTDNEYKKFLPKNYNDEYFEIMNKYFAKTLELKKKIQLENILFGDDISISEKVFNKNELIETVQNYLNVQNFDVYCHSDDDENQYLESISVCFNKISYEIIDCPRLSFDCDENNDIIVPIDY